MHKEKWLPWEIKNEIEYCCLSLLNVFLGISLFHLIKLLEHITNQVKSQKWKIYCPIMILLNFIKTLEM